MLTKEKLQCIKLFEEGLQLYRAKNFSDALLKFEEALKVYPEDGPSKVFVERCKYFLQNPVPEDWDGVFEMKTK
ncbi:MAG TPA: tetratricopeptide repeat protein [Spirochaetota bacterium]|nr:tetratricopeptide repeat protein [Spirochaetota bacterium]HOL57984.1 tetratricopeptide repeat protein [Spirochaetota bacterium]HPP05329.1 tetratricopeptide repeat protein [Spirochaetota bacterium]